MAQLRFGKPLRAALGAVFVTVALSGALAGAAAAPAAEPLAMLAQPGPWSAVSNMIGFRGRLWFANSVLFVNHNSADLYSYDPVTGGVRYEAHLFSQDVGEPAVSAGLLYWPFEDSRASTGRGEFMVTDGERWSWHVLPEAQAFHVHAMTAHRSRLVAATSAWRAGLQRSDDGGARWQVIYDHPSPPGRVSRLTSFANLDGALFAAMTAWREDGAKLFRITDDGATPVPAWPEGRALTGMAAHGGWLYAVNNTDSEFVLLRTDGTRTQPIPSPRGERVRALASDGALLWAITIRPAGGALWSSGDGFAWTLAQAFAGAEAADVAVYGGAVYVGTIGPQGRGALWGPPPPAPVEADGATAVLPSPWRPGGTSFARALEVMDAAFGGRDAHARHAEPIRAAVRRLAREGTADMGRAFEARLRTPAPEKSVSLFGGALVETAASLERWYLLWGLAYNGHGRVPVGLLSAPWAHEANRAEKYFEPAPLAMWAAARLGQDDAETIDALVRGLGRDGEPDWLDGDRIGALTALTGERFGYDVWAWRSWWQARRAP